MASTLLLVPSIFEMILFATIFVLARINQARMTYGNNIHVIPLTSCWCTRS